MRRALLIVALAVWPSVASAGLTEQQIGSVAFDPPPGARVPMWLPFKDVAGETVTIGQAIGGRPTLLIPADFTCKQICGPALTIAGSALQQTGLVAGRDYSVVVVGIDPRDTIEDARRFTEGQIATEGNSVLTGTRESIGQLLQMIGYHDAFDASRDAVAHPAAFATLGADGRVVRTLSSLALQPTDLRLALLEAGHGRIGGLAGRIALLCYGFDAVHGIYTRRITTVLRMAGAISVVLLASAIVLMLLRSSKRGASA
ncbi:SCO family protein [Bradyrhizobium sp. USDA 4353]